MNDNRVEKPWLIVATREILVKVTDRAFIVGTLVSVALIVGMLGLQIFLSNRTSTTKAVVTTSEARTFADQVGTVAHQRDDKASVEVTQLPDAAAARAAVTAGDADVYLAKTEQGWQLTFKDSVSGDLKQIVQEQSVQDALQANATRLGTTAAELQRGTTVTTQILVGSEQQAGLAKAVGFIFAILFFMSALGFGLQIAQSVVEEKQSRIVEILASAIPLRQLLAGKVVGNTVMALAQMILYTGVGLIGLAFTDYKNLVPALSASVAWYIAFFLAGFLALACIWAVAGSLASRQEDLQATTMPLTMTLTLIYVAGFTASGMVQTILSYVPVVSAVLMPVRLVEGSASWWQALVALLLNIAFAALTVYLGERIYRRSLLQTQGRIGYKQALQLTD